MSKPDAASGSLENILASIRKSLSEQATDAPSETPAAPAKPPKEPPLQRKGGLTQRLAGASSEASAPKAGQAGDDLADMLEEQIANPAPATKPAAAVSEAKTSEAKPPEEDPLWFLTRTDEPVAAEAAAAPTVAAESAGASPAAAAEPILTRPEVLRASMPPFFGSTAEAAKAEQPPVEARTASVSAAQPPRPPEVAPVVAAASHGAAHQGRPVDAGAAAATAAAQPPGGSLPLRNGLAGRHGETPGEARATPAGDTPHIRALESAVLELLKPMLSQWLERNMPRLVAEALKDEAARARTGQGGGNKA
jgi:hypothetical protein